MKRISKKFDGRILKLSMKDSVRNTFIALPIISFFEIVMIIRWIIEHASSTKLYHKLNFIGYVSLLVITLITLLLVYYVSKNFEKRHTLMRPLQLIYAFFFVLWALWMTFVGSKYVGSFDIIIYITIITVIPLFCFINPFYWSLIQIASAIFVLYLGKSYDYFSAFLINFTVFTILSTTGSVILYLRRYNSYKQLIELKDERDITHHYAYYDALTNLSNRRSYIEEIESIKSNGIKDNFIFASFDVNGLKKANDTLGHDAGDELIVAASSCISEAFSKYGKVFRVGGDEFTALIYASSDEMNNAIQEFNYLTNKWHGDMVNNISISLGYASKQDYPNLSIDELETKADNLMYKTKNNYYKAM